MLSIETVVPETVIRQEDVTRLFAGQPGMTRLGSRLVRSAFDGAGVATRHTVLPELAEAAARASHAPNAGPEDDRERGQATLPRTPHGEPTGDDAAASPFVDPVTGHLLSPGTHARNQLYTQNARELFVAAGRAALSGVGPGITAADVTHVVTVSCTCLLYTSPSPRDLSTSRMPSSA